MKRGRPGREDPMHNSANSTESGTADGLHSRKQEFTHAAMDSLGDLGKLTVVPSALDRAICRFASHDWWALSYPPARRWECHRCGTIMEEAPTSLPDRRKVPRDPIHKSNGTDRA